MELLLALPIGELSDTKVDVSAETFGQEFNGSLVHQVVISYLANSRSNTRAQKTRSEVQGGGAKPWKQKGGGRARAGTSRSPLWRSGGVTFAAKGNVNHSHKVNKKMYRGALCSILSELVRQTRLMIVKSEDVKLLEPKTRCLLTKLNAYGVQEALFVVCNCNINLYLASRNVPKVDVLEVQRINPVSLLKYEKIIMTEDAVRKIEEVLG